MTSFFQDLRHGFRLLVRQRGFTAVAVLVLAFGIGANTAVFMLVNALVIKPRPGVPDAELTGVYSRDRTQPDAYRAFSFPNYVDLRERTDLFASLTAHNFSLVGLTEGDKTKRVFVDISTGNFFDTFGVKLALGRTFTAEEERPGADIPVAILSYGAWQRMGGTPDVLSKRLKLNGREYDVVGVAPRGFGGSMAIVTPELWLPTGVYDSLDNDLIRDFIRDVTPATLKERRRHALILVARLKPGATIDSTLPALQTAGAQLERAYPAENHDQELSMARLSRMSVSTSPQKGDDELGVLGVLLFSMSGLVLLVASLNLANMLLARGSARRKEFALRLALGGTRLRIVRQLLTESVALSLAGGALATFVAWWATRLLVTSLSPMLPIVIDLDTTPDIRILGATVAFCFLSAVFFGLGPAWRHARTDALPELREQSGEGASRRRGRLTTRHVLVMGQLAFSLVTLTAAGLFVRASLENAKTDPGYTFERGIMANVDPSLAGRTKAQAQTFYQRALARLREMPGVESASFSSLMAFGEFTETRGVQQAGAPIRRKAGSASMSIGGGPGAESTDGLIDSIATSVGTDYFRTMGLKVLAGREFTPAEETGPIDANIAIIDETLARALFGAANPLDEVVQYSERDGGDVVRLRVVGLVAASRHELLDRVHQAHIYTPYGQDFRFSMFLHVRTAAPSAEAESAMLPGIRRELMALDPSLPVITLETRPTYRDRNFELWLLGAGADIFLTFGALALFMSVVGVYGVKAYIVARRTREIGIRVALGATGGDVTRLVVREGLVLSVIGVVLGIGLSTLAGSALRSMLFDDTRFDAPVVLGAAVVLASAAMLASWLPARRATRIAPTIALRSE